MVKGRIPEYTVEEEDVKTYLLDFLLVLQCSLLWVLGAWSASCA